MSKLKSMLLTLLCAGMILGIGYLAIVESGKKVLERERVLEESLYEDTSSNIFYGKIEKNIELFPWSYYPEEDEEKIYGAYPRFQEIVMDSWGGAEELKVLQNWYLCQLIGWGSDTPAEEIMEWYDKNQKSIMNNMVMTENSFLGSIYFYQDILELGEKKYQVRIACSEWNIISFTCMEYREGQERNREAWETGKERLVEVLENSEDEMTGYFDYMMFLRNTVMASIYNYKDGEELYINAYLESLHWLEEILVNQEHEGVYVPEDIRTIIEEWVYPDANSVEVGVLNEEKEKVMVENSQPSYSYQIVELQDMILLLMQGEETLGVYYDPIAQSFCGYNYFYEY